MQRLIAVVSVLSQISVIDTVCQDNVGILFGVFRIFVFFTSCGAGE